MTRLFTIAPSVLLLSCLPVEGPPIDDPFTQCTEMSCDDNLTITFERRDMEPFLPGTYTFVLEPDSGNTMGFTCSLENERLSGCTGDYSSLSVSAGSGAHELTVTIPFSPQVITVSLQYADQLLGDQRIVPEYFIVQPNGPLCEPTCFQASVTIEVATPIP